MGVFEELKERGLIAQVTNEEKVKDLINNDKIAFYVGFDPTADSLHIGHFVQMMVISHLQKAGHTPLILFGGGTAMIGDPSGKTDMRKMLSKEQIEHNIACFKKQMSGLIDFSDNKALMLNNGDWLFNLKYIEFLRDIGVHFSVNWMLAAECYKQRMEKGLSFFEMNYMIMQSYDFLHLNREYNCMLELGGDDQWSNIIGGVHLVRKKEGKDVYGMTFNLLTTSEGKKMGKTEKGAVWLDPKKTTPYELYQYFRNVADGDVIKCLKMVTFVPMEKIRELEKLEGREINKAKEILAYEVTAIIHGEEEAQKAQNAARAIFSAGQSSENMPSTILSKEDFENDNLGIVDALIKAKLVSSKGEARRLIEQGGVSLIINNDIKKISSVSECINKQDLNDKDVVIKKGKKVYHKLILKKETL